MGRFDHDTKNDTTFTKKDRKTRPPDTPGVSYVQQTASRAVSGCGGSDACPPLIVGSHFESPSPSSVLAWVLSFMSVRVRVRVRVRARVRVRVWVRVSSPGC